MNENKNYTRIWGLSSSIAFRIAMKALFPDGQIADFASHEFKNSSKLFEAINRGIKPIQEVIDVIHEGQEARVKGKFDAGVCSLKKSLSSELSEEDRFYFLEEALFSLDDAYNIMSNVPYLLMQKSDVAKFIAVTHLALGHYETCKTWLFKAEKHYNAVLKSELEEYTASERMAIDTNPKIFIKRHFGKSSIKDIAIMLTGMAMSSPIIVVNNLAVKKDLDSKNASNSKLKTAKEQAQLALAEVKRLLIYFEE
jgi:hypothetical protein